ncbi:MAG: NAD(P)(+) transhydrogenase (Re/Si-specific) subunit beta [Acidimicrobiia bacterium]|nr:NAD(P)(+) transhydrogenase (Re/Si-specific) subunit beta [Acidimicrobiia bacterium]
MDTVIQLGYLASAVLFILGLKRLSRPRTAVQGNLMSSVGMLLAVVVTLFNADIVSFWVIAAGLIVGGGVGTLLAIRVAMTGMPQLVALFNGFGGLASLLVGAATLEQALDLADGADLGVEFLSTASLTVLIGSITFSGSVVAFAKLQEIWRDLGSPTVVRAANIGLVALSALLAVMIVVSPTSWWLWALAVVALVAGVTLVSPIGGADMPVVIALLNSLSGLAASTTGFVLDNSLLIIAGALVGASGLVLTFIMCTAMNRTLVNVLFGGIDTSGVVADGDEVYAGKITSSSADEVAMILDTAERVAIVPGYGMAVAQAQHAVRDLTTALEARGIDVVFAIHPVAGRMPGHMNVLLAEAEIPYEQLKEMEVVNPSFPQVDVAIIIGANDVVNPDARENPSSPIAGMPILDVDRARTVVVIKRSLSPGFAGIPNPLFALDNTLMLFGDGKAAVEDISAAMAEL